VRSVLIAEYLSLATRDEDPGVLLKALGDVAKPWFETIATIMRGLIVGFSVESRLAMRAKKARKSKAA